MAAVGRFYRTIEKSDSVGAKILDPATHSDALMICGLVMPCLLQVSQTRHCCFHRFRECDVVFGLKPFWTFEIITMDHAQTVHRWRLLWGSLQSNRILCVTTFIFCSNSVVFSLHEAKSQVERGHENANIWHTISWDQHCVTRPHPVAPVLPTGIRTRWSQEAKGFDAKFWVRNMSEVDLRHIRSKKWLLLSIQMVFNLLRNFEPSSMHCGKPRKPQEAEIQQLQAQLKEAVVSFDAGNYCTQRIIGR